MRAAAVESHVYVHQQFWCRAFLPGCVCFVTRFCRIWKHLGVSGTDHITCTVDVSRVVSVTVQKTGEGSIEDTVDVD